ncbi:MAG: alcohol dehydrogenase catalytic domain-containing protein [Butyricicoccus pullicaecorum]|jgi:threonine dehydrogenase-like Zn-dependent dehydrogenase|nr:alcohol dehydrogenase catalytic domain-containing protein [Butyricicoccus pullicaecorum]
MSTMLAAVFEGNGVLNVKEVPKPQIMHPDDVLIKVGAASICGSDLHVLHVPPGQYAKPGVILGHEYFGYVEEVGEAVTRFHHGDKVVVDNIMKCHTCEYCTTGMDNLCPDAVIYGQQLDGGFAQYCVVKASQLMSMPESVPSYLAAQTEPLSCVMNGMKKINPTPADHVVIFGMGPIGLTFVRVMKLYGVKHLAVCEMSESRRKKALDCGADLAIDPSAEDVAEVLHKAWGDTCDIVVDAVGAGAVFSQAVHLLKCGGRLLIFGQNANAMSQVPPAVIVRNELTVMGTYCAHHTFPIAIQLLQNPELGLEKIISHKMDLKDIKYGIELLNAQQASRVIVYPNGVD